MITGTAEIAPNTNIGGHSHPGIETGYVLEGEMTLLVEGQPLVKLKPGDSYKVPERAIHDARTGNGPAKVLAVYIGRKRQAAGEVCGVNAPAPGAIGGRLRAPCTRSDQ